MTNQHDPYAAFRIPAYRTFMLGWLAATIGTRIQSIAIAWEMYQRTGEALSLGLVGGAQAIPSIFLALFAGYLADRFERRKLIMLSLVGMSITSLSLAVLSYIEGPIVLMYILLMLDTAAMILGRPARVAFVPQIVPASVLANAVTWEVSLMQISAFIGPAIGGFIIAYSIPSAYVLSALGSLGFIVLLIRLGVQAGGQTQEKANVKTLFAGVQFVWDKKILITIMSLDLFAVLLGGAVYLLPIFAEDILNVGATGFGWLQAAPSVGAFSMALLMAYLPPMKRAGRIMLWAIGGFGVATIVFGLSSSFWLSLVMLFITGALDNISMVVRHTLMQLLTPDNMRGRVSAVHSVFTGSSNQLGGLESGLVAHWFGPIVSVVSGGIGTIIVVLVTAALSPQLRAIGRLDENTA